jgi:tRNA uridine 5-carboxymethylaminomethyl modification enzyme
MFTSRAEHRLLLREDNADQRLGEIGYRIGLLGESSRARLHAKERWIAAEIRRLEETTISPSPAVQTALARIGTTPIRRPLSLAALLRRPEVGYVELLALTAPVPRVASPEAAAQVEIEIKYGGYVERQRQLVERTRGVDDIRLPSDLDYERISGLSNEAREKLAKIRPRSLGQASRIVGITPAAVSLLAIHLRRTGLA